MESELELAFLDGLKLCLAPHMLITI